MNVTVISTVKNEGDSIRPLLDSLIQQSRQPDEVVICDGGSTDSTIEVLIEYQQWLPLKIVVAPDSNISQGRNQAIKAATSEIIAATDGGVILAPYWLEELVKPIEAGETAVSSGWFEADPYTDFEVIMGSTVLPARGEIDPSKFLPSSRSVAFLKTAWEAVGGYPEWLDFSEDLLFDVALRDKYGEFPFVDTAVAYFRPRGSLRSYFRQYYTYARGDGKANLWPRRHFIRYITYLLGIPFILRLIWREKWPGWIMLLLGTGVYCQKPAQRLWINTWGWRPPARARAFALIPIIRLVGDIAKMIGYPVGLIWRLRNQDKMIE
ncbi:MAG: glycosyltransferase [Chloroflexi bacterium]|nr:glycosyltransferase [Chloroflexota bacterium]